jgi:N-acetylglutamate synthase-like GNAT family acetyltransferase
MVQALLAMPLLHSLNELYPGFQSWYVSTVVPGVVAGRDVLLLATEGAQVAGIALGKRSDDEVKLRCVRVVPAYQNTGVGLKLIENMFEALECDKPHCTVAEELMHTYSRAFVNRYGFALSDVARGRYRRGKLEYAFN